MRLLNIGCGPLVHPAWTNLDINPWSPYVISHDIRRGLPFSDSEFDACYSSHVLEHLTPGQARRTLAECSRVLKVAGIIRIVVPDLESIVRNYLQTLEDAKAGATGSEQNYDWMMLELLDQMVRDVSGGDMARYLSNPDIRNKEFVAARVGIEANQYWRSGKELPIRLPRPLARKIPILVRRIRLTLAELSVRCLAGSEAKVSFSEGLFRRGGEIHRWAYDRFSLGRLLARSEFVNIRVCEAHESGIPDFCHYELDIVGGQIRKPDSLFMEARKV